MLWRSCVRIVTTWTFTSMTAPDLAIGSRTWISRQWPQFMSAKRKYKLQQEGDIDDSFAHHDCGQGLGVGQTSQVEFFSQELPRVHARSNVVMAA